MLRQHRIDIVETDTSVTAKIVDLRTGKQLMISLNRSDYGTRDEMIGELFAGGLPNIRDCYDSDTWVSESSVVRPEGCLCPPSCGHCAAGLHASCLMECDGDLYE
jgi:hypothetical protein